MKLIVSEANRSEVSFYSADLSGVSERAAEQVTQALIGSARVGSSETELAESITQSERAPRKNGFPGTSTGQSRLQTLASETGGRSTDASNGVRKFARVALEDGEAFYEVQYQQPIEKPDVHFRTLAVRVSRKGWQVQARAGAFPSLLLGGKELSGFEIPLVGALSASPKAETIWFSGEALPGSQPGAPTVTNLLVRVPLSGLVAHELDQTKRFRFHVTILALLKDRDGQIVDKVSRDSVLEGALESLSRARKDDYTFSAPFEADPKGCRVDIAIRDEFASKISTKSVQCSLTASASGSTLGSASSPFIETENTESEAAASATALAPATLLKGSSRPSEQQVEALIQGAKARVLDYKKTLPNVICTMVTRRSVGIAGHDAWKPLDSSTSLLTYVNGKENEVPVNGDHHQESDEGAELKGAFEISSLCPSPRRQVPESSGKAKRS